MLESLLAAIQTVEPTSLPLWAAFVFSLAMYPLGILLPCGRPCQCCCPQGETLPDAVTLSLEGLTQSAVKTGPLLSLSISSCFGGGASGTVVAAGGKPDEGWPITAVTLTSGGAGYAVRGREEPTGLSFNSPFGSGAEFEIVLAEATDECGRPTWAIESAKVTKGGEGYEDGYPLTVSLGADEYEHAAAVLTLATVPTQPTLSLHAPFSQGSGAEVEIATTLVSQNPNRWGASAVTVVVGGTNYSDGEQVQFAGEPFGAFGQQFGGLGNIQTKHVEPQTVVMSLGSAGHDAEFTPMLEKFTENGRDYWRVDELIVNQGGFDYAVGDFLQVEADGNADGVTVSWSVWTITAVSGSGSILGVQRNGDGGKMFGDTGEIEAVEIVDAGSFYGPSGEAGTVTVTSGGGYYKENETLPAIVAEVTFDIQQTFPSNGSGAEISATIDEDYESETFGQITALTLDAGGDGYLGFSYTLLDCCLDSYNGKTFLLKRVAGTCQFQKDCCGTNGGAMFTVTYRGAETPPTVTIGGACGFTFDIDEADAPFACDGLNFTGTHIFGGTVTVAEATGAEDEEETKCPGCCRGEGKGHLCESQCVDGGGTWFQTCACRSCNLDECEGLSIVVTIDIDWLAYDAANFQNYSVVQSYTVTLSSENDWSESQGDLNENGGFAEAFRAGGVPVCALNVGFAISSGGPDLMNGTFGLTQVIGIGAALSLAGPIVVSIPGDENAAGFVCPADGAQLRREWGNAFGTKIGTADITVTVAT